MSFMGSTVLRRNKLLSKYIYNYLKYDSLRLMGICYCNSNSFSDKLTSKYFSPTHRHSNNSSKISNECLRFFSSESGPPSTKLPPLMTFPHLIWPSIIKSIRNFILTTFIIKPYMDRDFSFPDFVVGSKKAVEVISTKISEGNIKDLDGLVTPDVTEDVQKAVAQMSLPQREQIAIVAEDIYFSFPYQVGIIFNENDNQDDQKRFVEITMVYHALRGLAQMKLRGEEPPVNMGVLPEFRDKICICNYRFVREYTKGVDSDWTVNLLNHFKPNDEYEE